MGSLPINTPEVFIDIIPKAVEIIPAFVAILITGSSSFLIYLIPNKDKIVGIAYTSIRIGLVPSSSQDFQSLTTLTY